VVNYFYFIRKDVLSCLIEDFKILKIILSIFIKLWT